MEGEGQVNDNPGGDEHGGEKQDQNCSSGGDENEGSGRTISNQQTKQQGVTNTGVADLMANEGVSSQNCGPDHSTFRRHLLSSMFPTLPS